MIGETPIDIRPFMARTAAANILVQCFPLLLADAVRRAHRGAFLHFQAPNAEAAALAGGLAEDDARIVVSSAWIELAKEPVVLRVPHARGRYVSTTLLDSAGEPFASFGSRTGNDSGLDLALVGPRWTGELPSGLLAKRAPSESVWVVSRIRAHSPLDQAEAIKLAEQYCLARLVGRRDVQQPAAAASEPRALHCLRQIQQLTPAQLFDRLDAVLERAPPSCQHTVVPRVSALRRELGGPPKSSEWTPEFADALACGLAEGMAAIGAAAQSQPADETSDWRSWGVGAPGGSLDALTRAARAFAALGAPLREDQLTLECAHDEAGRPLSGAHCYRLRFARGALPPVDGFWWLSTRPAASSGQRGGLGSRSDLALDPKGSLELLLGPAPPDIDQLANWLPTPAGKWTLALRLYGPRPAALSGAWRIPPLERLDGVGANRGEWRPLSGFPIPPRASFGRRDRLGG